MSEVTESKSASTPVANNDPAPVSEKRAIQELNPARMKECEFERTVYTCTTHEETQPEDLLNPSYWTHVAEKFKPFDKIEARGDRGEWYAEYIVLESSRRWTRTHMLSKHMLTTPDVSVTQAKLQEFAVEWKGPHRKFCVIRVSDQEMIHDGEASKEGAYAWLAGRIKAGI